MAKESRRPVIGDGYPTVQRKIANRSREGGPAGAGVTQ
jgi:hypothetical protein